MRQKVLEIINSIRASKNLPALDALKDSDTLLFDLQLTSFDLAELTVKLEDEYGVDIFEDGLVNTIGEIYAKLSE
jgi:acyl carrier protein